MKKNILIGLLILAAIVVVGMNGIGTATANPSVIQIYRSSTGTSTAAWLVASAASSTLAFIPENSDLMAVSVWSSASSTSAVINFAFQYSDNNTDWYDAEVASTTNATGGKYVLSQGTATAPWAWTPGAATTSRTWLMPTQPPAKYGRLLYQATGAGGYFHVQVNLKKQF